MTFPWMPAALGCLALAGCAAPAPVPFQLLDSQAHVYRGNFLPGPQTLSVDIGNRHYRGFYLVETGLATTTQTWPAWRGFPRDSTTIINSNAARAYLKAEDGAQLSCQFLFEGSRALGDCVSPGGEKYQLVVDGQP